MIYLYIMFELSNFGTVYKWRVQQVSMQECLKVLETSKTKIANDGTLGVAITCGTGEIERFHKGKWQR